MRVIFVVLIVLFAGGAFGEGEHPVEKPKREYTSSINLYEVDLGVDAPAEAEEGDDEVLELDDEAFRMRVNPMLLNNYQTPDYSQPEDTGRRRKKNWILPPMSEDLKEHMRRNRDEDEEDEETGSWGWLEEDIRERRDRASQENGEAEDEEDPEAAAELRLERDGREGMITPLFESVIDSSATELRPVDGSSARRGSSSASLAELEADEIERRVKEGDYEGILRQSAAGANAESSVWSDDAEESDYLPRTGALLGGFKVREGVARNAGAGQPQAFVPTGSLTVRPQQSSGSGLGQIGGSPGLFSGRGGALSGSSVSSSPLGGSFSGNSSFRSIGTDSSVSGGAMKRLEPYKPIQASQQYQDPWKNP